MDLITKRCQLLAAFIQILWIITINAQSKKFQQNSASLQVSLELCGSKPFPYLEDLSEYLNRNCFHLQLNGLNLTSILPGATSDTSVIFKLYRDSLLNKGSKLKNGQTNVLVISKKGSHYLQDEANSLFRGIVQLSYSTGNYSTITTPRFHSEVLANGHINRATRYVWLLAFIKLGDDYFYIRPSIGNSLSSSSTFPTSNVHLISRTSVQYFNLFKSQFRSSKARAKRSSSSFKSSERPNSCPMEINVDHSLFERMGKEPHQTVYFVQTVFSFANNIFLRTAWRRSGGGKEVAGSKEEEEEILEGYGNTLCRLKIYEEAPEDELSPLYNKGHSFWDADYMLFKVLPRLPHINNYCLSYLFTNMQIIEMKNQDLNGNAVPEGIFKKEGNNVGAVSFHDCPDPLDLFCMLTFAHELGHSWGAGHDPSSKECIPASGGSYLMGTPFLFEKGPNNMIFSPCSVRSIYQSIISVPELTFKSYCSLCGNGVIDHQDEQCDEGAHNGGDYCCAEGCTLRQNAQCSPFNHDCCNRHCKMANSGQLCRRPDELYCRHEARCTGTSLTCPPGERKADGESCSAGGGICHAGYCTTSCPKEYTRCDCPGAAQPVGTEEYMADQCYLCCRKNSSTEPDSSCSNSQVPLPAGYGCKLSETVFGACRAGFCEEIELVEDPRAPPMDESDERSKGVSFWVGLTIFIVIIAIVLVLLGLYLFRKHYPTRRMTDLIEHHPQQQEVQDDQPQHTIVMYSAHVSLLNEKNGPSSAEDEKKSAVVNENGNGHHHHLE